jgi:hypothetical protein
LEKEIILERRDRKREVFEIVLRTCKSQRRLCGEMAWSDAPGRFLLLRYRKGKDR